MESRDLCGSLGSGLVARGEELILFSSGDKYLGALTMPRRQVSVTDSRVRRAVFKGAIQKAPWSEIQARARRQECFVLLYSLHRGFKDTISFKVETTEPEIPV